MSSLPQLFGSLSPLVQRDACNQRTSKQPKPTQEDLPDCIKCRICLSNVYFACNPKFVRRQPTPCTHHEHSAIVAVTCHIDFVFPLGGARSHLRQRPRLSRQSRTKPLCQIDSWISQFQFKRCATGWVFRNQIQISQLTIKSAIR